MGDPQSLQSAPGRACRVHSEASPHYTRVSYQHAQALPLTADRLFMSPSSRVRDEQPASWSVPALPNAPSSEAADPPEGSHDAPNEESIPSLPTEGASRQLSQARELLGGVVRRLVRTSLRTRLLVVAAVILIGAVFVIGGFGQHTTVAGTFRIVNSVAVLEGISDAEGASARTAVDTLLDLTKGETFDCGTLYGRYADIGTGTQIRVTDAGGKVLAVSSLEGGLLNHSGCHFTFDISVPRSKMYQFEVSDRGQVVFTRDDLERMDWKVALDL